MKHDRSSFKVNNLKYLSVFFVQLSKGHLAVYYISPQSLK